MNYEDEIFFFIFLHFLIKCYKNKKIEYSRYMLETILYYIDLKMSLNFFIYLIHIYRFLNIMDYLAEIYEKKEEIKYYYKILNFSFKELIKYHNNE